MTLTAAASRFQLSEALLRLGEPVVLGEIKVPALRPEDLGDPAFRAEYGVKYAYATGAMANGIASEALVEAGAKAGFLSFFGAAGLSPQRVEQAIETLRGIGTHGFNLIHSPNDASLEEAVADLYLRKGVTCVEASAYLALTPAIVRYRAAGLRRGAGGEIVCENKVVAKVSRVEVASKFMSPAPTAMLRELVAGGKITDEQARLAERVPVASDITAEADSGGHTDNRPLVTLLPTLLSLRDRLQKEHGYPIRVGAAGGIATPASAAAAFMMGASYVLTGSINQACRESGSSDIVRKMLAEAGQADTAMAPAADMFEMGVKVQVLKRGTLFAARAAKLYEVYRLYESWEAVPAALKVQIERDLLRAPFERIWAQTRDFFLTRDPIEVERAHKDAKHKMALVFRWYLGLASRWANAGEPSRQVDYQIWCGPAMGAFNEWAKGSCLEAPVNRGVALVGQNILFGAAYLTRLHFLRCQGAAISPDLANIRPMTSREIEDYLRS